MELSVAASAGRADARNVADQGTWTLRAGLRLQQHRQGAPEAGNAGPTADRIRPQVHQALRMLLALAIRAACRRRGGTLSAGCTINGPSVPYSARERLRDGHLGSVLTLLPVRSTVAQAIPLLPPIASCQREASSFSLR